MSLRKCPIGVKNIVEVYSTTILGYRNKFKWYNDKILVFFRCFILYDLTLKNFFLSTITFWGKRFALIINVNSSFWYHFRFNWYFF